MVKELLTLNAAETDLHLVQQRESERLLVCWETAEHKEAVAAFKEKRPPKFR
jgi:enoyl-CoA hydratase/carnithine racemase